MKTTLVATMLAVAVLASGTAAQLTGAKTALKAITTIYLDGVTGTHTIENKVYSNAVRINNVAAGLDLRLNRIQFGSDVTIDFKDASPDNVTIRFTSSTATSGGVTIANLGDNAELVFSSVSIRDGVSLGSLGASAKVTLSSASINTMTGGNNADSAQCYLVNLGTGTTCNNQDLVSTLVYSTKKMKCCPPGTPVATPAPNTPVPTPAPQVLKATRVKQPVVAVPPATTTAAPLVPVTRVLKAKTPVTTDAATRAVVPASGVPRTTAVPTPQPIPTNAEIIDLDNDSTGTRTIASVTYQNDLYIINVPAGFVLRLTSLSAGGSVFIRFKTDAPDNVKLIFTSLSIYGGGVTVEDLGDNAELRFTSLFIRDPITFGALGSNAGLIFASLSVGGLTGGNNANAAACYDVALGTKCNNQDLISSINFGGSRVTCCPAGSPVVATPAPPPRVNVCGTGQYSNATAYYAPSAECLAEIGDVADCFQGYEWCKGNASNCKKLLKCARRRTKCLNNVPEPANATSNCSSWWSTLNSQRLNLTNREKYEASSLYPACLRSACEAAGEKLSLNNGVACPLTEPERVCKRPRAPVKYTLTFGSEYSVDILTNPRRLARVKRLAARGIARVLKLKEELIQILEVRRGSLLVDFALTADEDDVDERSEAEVSYEEVQKNLQAGVSDTISTTSNFAELAQETGVAPALTATAVADLPAGQTPAPQPSPSSGAVMSSPVLVAVVAAALVALLL